MLLWQKRKICWSTSSSTCNIFKMDGRVENGKKNISLKIASINYLTGIFLNYIYVSFISLLILIKCTCYNNFRETKDGAIKGWFWGYEKIEVRNISCVSFQGHFRKLLPILSQHSKKSGDIIMIDRGEIPLHDDYGGVEYWKVIYKLV